MSPAATETGPYLGYIIAPDSLGGIYLLYSLTLGDLRIQHLGPNGERLWGLTGLPFSPLGEENELAPDGTGGFVEICREGSTGSTLYAYRIDSEGNWVWDEEETCISEMYWQKAIICRYPDIFVCWQSSEFPFIAELQDLDYQGNLMLNEPVDIFSVQTSQGDISMSDANGTGLIFGCERMISTSEAVFITQKYDYEIQRLWSDNDVEIAVGENTKMNLTQSPFPPGGAVCCWFEVFPSLGQLVCAAMVNAYGELGVVRITPEQSNEQPVCFSLLPAFPNPFNATTKITFTLPVRSYVKLDVFDISGRNVGARLPRPDTAGFGESDLRWYAPGTHTVLFDGSGLASGIYIVRLQAGNFTQSRKLVLLK